PQRARALRFLPRQAAGLPGAHKGICRLLKHVAYRQHRGVNQNIAVRWVRGLPAKRDKCWFLMSSLERGPAQVSQLYAKRMTIEELFRDGKSKRNGWSLRGTRNCPAPSVWTGCC